MNRLPDYLDHIEEAAALACDYVKGTDWSWKINRACGLLSLRR